MVALGADFDYLPPPAPWQVERARTANEGAHFTCAWHGERAPGARPVPAPSEAIVEHAGGPLAVRVWGDDGSVATRVVSIDESRGASRSGRAVRG